jgi:hypothetical protein
MDAKSSKRGKIAGAKKLAALKSPPVASSPAEFATGDDRKTPSSTKKRGSASKGMASTQETAAKRSRKGAKQAKIQAKSRAASSKKRIEKLYPSLGDAKRVKRLIEIVKDLPEVEIENPHAEHLAFKVRKKTFAYYVDNHHGDGKVSIWCKNKLPKQKVKLAENPRSFYKPAYLGVCGWIALRLDLATVDWGEAFAILCEAYRLSAPKRLIEQLESE